MEMFAPKISVVPAHQATALVEDVPIHQSLMDQSFQEKSVRNVRVEMHQTSLIVDVVMVDRVYVRAVPAKI